MSDREQEIAEALTQSDEELLARLGASIRRKRSPRETSRTRGSAFPPRMELVASGKRWMAARSHELAEGVCKNEIIKAFSKQDVNTHETIVVLCGIIELSRHLRDLLGDVSVVTVSVLIVRLGLHRFCSQIWSSSETLKP